MFFMLYVRIDMYMYMYMKVKIFIGICICICKLNMDFEEWVKYVIEICMILLFYFNSLG